MLRRYWLSAVALGLTLSAALAQAPEPQRVTQSNPSDSTHSAAEAADDKRDPTKAEPKPPVPNAAVEARQAPQKANDAGGDDKKTSKSDSGDLTQQIRMADAAEWQLWISGIAAFLTLVAAGATAWAAWAAVIVAKAAEKSANVSEDAFRRLERPYLFIRFDNMSAHYLRVKYVPHGIPYMTFKLVNSGKMPATLRNIAAVLEPDPQLPLRIPLISNRAVYEVIEPGQESVIISRVDVVGGQVGEPVRGADITRLVFHGSVTYEDPTGALHTDRFCMRGAQNSTPFVVEGGAEYNYRKTQYPEA